MPQEARISKDPETLRETQSSAGRVLVVDDEQDIIVILSYIMRKAGFEVFDASSGNGALRSVSENAVELVLLDYMLPDINGLEVLKTIKRQNPDVDVVIVTGRGNDKVHDDVMQAGASGYVVKPFLNDKLVELAEKIISERRAEKRDGSSPV